MSLGISKPDLTGDKKLGANLQGRAFHMSRFPLWASLINRGVGTNPNIKEKLKYRGLALIYQSERNSVNCLRVK